MRDWPNLLADAGSIRTIPGADESVAAARCRIDGHDAVLIWCRFDVAAGTLSVAAGERFVAAVDDAVGSGVPVVAVANSGGARMQEGSRGFLQMIAVTRAVRRLRDAGLPFVVYLADPTTGGVLASWASLGHVTFAEPGATIGFTGPRVAAALGEPIEPSASQTAEGLLANGLVDDLVAPGDLRARVAGVLRATAPASTTGSERPLEAAEGPRGWAAVEAARAGADDRVLDRVLARSSDIVRLCGDRDGSRGDDVFTGICRVDGRPLVVIGHRRAARPAVAELRAARRAMATADELGLPVLTVIDTPGAAIGGEPERRGLAGEIARSIDALAALRVPSVALVAGQGSGGAAMAWLAADIVLAATDSWLAPIAPEAASLIVHRDVAHAAELADEQAIGAIELREQGLVRGVYDREHLLDAALAALDAIVAGEVAQPVARLTVRGPG